MEWADLTISLVFLLVIGLGAWAMYLCNTNNNSGPED
jgi:hypothetical protein